MHAHWYVTISGLPQGPMTEERLRELARSGFLKPSDQVCSAGSEWRPAYTVPGLFPSSSLPPPTYAAPLPPTAPPMAPMAPPMATAMAPQMPAYQAPAPGPSVSFTGSQVSKKRAASGSKRMAAFFSSAAALVVGAAAAIYIYFQLDPLIDKITGRDAVAPEVEVAGPLEVGPNATGTAAPTPNIAAPVPPPPSIPQSRPAPAVNSTPPSNGAQQNVKVMPIIRDAVAMVRVQVTDRSPIFSTGFVIGDSQGRMGLVTCLDALRPGRPMSIQFAANRVNDVTGFLAVLPEANLVLLQVVDELVQPMRLADAPPAVGTVVFASGVRNITGAMETSSARLRASLKPAGPSTLAPAFSLSGVPSTTYHGGPVVNDAGDVIGVVLLEGTDKVHVVGADRITELFARVEAVRPIDQLDSISSVTPPTPVAKPIETAAVPAAVPSPIPSRIAVPAAAAIEKGEQLFGEVYGDKFAKAKAPAAKAELVNELLGAVEKKQDAAEVRYILLRKSEALAVEAGDPVLIERIVGLLSAEFEVDRFEVFASALNQAVEKALLPATAKDLGKAAYATIDEAESHDRFAEALEFQKIAVDGAKKSRDPFLQKSFERRGERLIAANQAFDAAERGLAVLKTMPDDPDANLAVGRYLSFTKGNWDEGLAGLAEGADATLASLAKKSLTNPTDTAQQVEIGDAWWDAAEAVKGDEVRRLELRQGSRYWYAQAIDQLNGLSRVRVEIRLKSLEAELGAALNDSASNVPPPLAGRLKKDELLKTYGGSSQTEAAVQSSLNWLAKHQLANGFWSLTGADKTNKAAYTKGSTYENNEAATAMALLAFVGAGETHRSGSHAAAIDKALQSLLRVQDASGNFHHSVRQDDALYTQALCLSAICELYALSGDEDLREPCQRAMQYVLVSQDPALGGWRYRPRSDSDTSVTGWMMSALRGAQSAGLDVPKANLNMVSSYLDKVAKSITSSSTDSLVGSRYAYQPGMDYDKVMTAEGLMCRIYLGWPKDEPRLIKGCDLLLENLPVWSERDTYFWYHATQMMFHMQGRYWDRWNQSLRDMLVTKQEKLGPEAGSWDPLDNEGPDLWSLNKHGGRLYVTSLSAMMLEVYYRHQPHYQVADSR